VRVESHPILSYFSGETDVKGRWRKKFNLLAFAAWLALAAPWTAGCTTDTMPPPVRDAVGFPFSEDGRLDPVVFGQLRSQWIASAYFDRGMHYEGSRFRAVALAELIRKYRPEERWDAVLLECHDDYQGLISISDILNYDLRLALEMKLAPGRPRPGWLNPMVVIVPDGTSAPRQERFMTANIRELRFVRLTDYYAPLDKVALKSMNAHLGGQVFKDNCLFCHSLKGIGGNKGTALLAAYDFSDRAEGARFKQDFVAFHDKDNADKQDMEQFVDSQTLRRLVVFLREVSRRP